MKIWLIFSFLWAIGVCGIALENVRAEESLVVPMEPSIPLGERLVYQITWLWIPVGLGEIWVKEKTMLAGREVIHIVGVIKTNHVLSKIFPMHDEAHSWVDAKTLQSVQFEKEIKELVIKTHERMVFDGAAKKGYFESLRSKEKKEFDIRVPIYDVLSVFYWTRQQNLVLGESVKTSLVADQKEWELEAHVRSRKTVRFHGEKIQTLRIEPITRVEGQEKRGKAWFYLTEDSSRLPIRIVYKAIFGTVVGTLKCAEGLVNPSLVPACQQTRSPSDYS